MCTSIRLHTILHQQSNKMKKKYTTLSEKLKNLIENRRNRLKKIDTAKTHT